MYTIHRFKLICPDCETKIVKEAQKEFIELLNHNKTKIIKGEERIVNEIWLDLDFLRSLIK